MKRIFAISLIVALIIAGGSMNCSDAQQTSGTTAAAPLTTGTLAAPAATSGSAVLDLFYMGNRASRLESCGCHSRQQGGIQFEAVLYAQRGANPDLRLDLGDWATFAINEKPVDLMGTRYVLRALTMMQMDAVNLGPRDLELTTKYFKDFEAKFPGQMPPLVSANVYLKETPDQRAFPASRIVEKTVGGAKIKVGITGVAWPYDEDYMVARGAAKPTQRETVSYVAKAPVQSLAEVIKALRPKVDLLIVMSSGEAESAPEIAKAYPDVDFVIARNAPDAPQTATQLEGKVRLLFGRNSQGKELGYVPLERKDGQWVFKALPAWLPVAKDVTPDTKSLELIEEFKKETRKLKPKLPPPDVKEAYAGAVMCKMCHAKEYESWSKTRHAGAMATLIGKEQQFNPNCVKCHVTGFQEANGFYAIEHPPSQQMANVQCEACHGPGFDHADAERLKMAGGQSFMPAAEYAKKIEAGKKNHPRKEVPEKVCLGCHTPENDDNFVYGVKQPKVKH